jgi:hypothetical protein
MDRTVSLAFVYAAVHRVVEDPVQVAARDDGMEYLDTLKLGRTDGLVVVLLGPANLSLVVAHGGSPLCAQAGSAKL